MAPKMAAAGWSSGAGTLLSSSEVDERHPCRLQKPLAAQADSSPQSQHPPSGWREM